MQALNLGSVAGDPLLPKQQQPTVLLCEVCCQVQRQVCVTTSTGTSLRSSATYCQKCFFMLPEAEVFFLNPRHGCVKHALLTLPATSNPLQGTSLCAESVQMDSLCQFATAARSAPRGRRQTNRLFPPPLARKQPWAATADRSGNGHAAW